MRACMPLEGHAPRPPAPSTLRSLSSMWSAPQVWHFQKTDLHDEGVGVGMTNRRGALVLSDGANQFLGLAAPCTRHALVSGGRILDHAFEALGHNFNVLSRSSQLSAGTHVRANVTSRAAHSLLSSSAVPPLLTASTACRRSRMP